MGGIRKEREGYLSGNGPVNRHQRILTKEAILVLVGKRRHNSLEIAEHFGLEPGVVDQLVDELIKKGRIIREKGTLAAEYYENRSPVSDCMTRIKHTDQNFKEA